MRKYIQPVVLCVLLLTGFVSLGFTQEENGETETETEKPKVIKEINSDHLSSAVAEVGCRRVKGNRSRHVGTGGLVVSPDGLVLVTDLNRIYPFEGPRKAGVKIKNTEETKESEGKYTVKIEDKTYIAKYYAMMKAINLGLLKITNAPEKKKFNHLKFTKKDGLSKGDNVVVRRTHSENLKKYEFTIRGGKKTKAGHQIYMTRTHLARPPHMLLDLHPLADDSNKIVGLVSAAPAKKKGRGTTTHRGRPRIVLYSDFQSLIENPEKHTVSSDEDGDK